MASEEPGTLSKEQRRALRQQAATRRRRLQRLRPAAIVAVIIAIPVLWVIERSGEQELVEAEVVETRLWRHFPATGPAHDHRSATLRIEGLAEATLERADGYERQQRVQVWIRRGQISGWPYFLDLAQPGEIERQQPTRELDEDASTEGDQT